MKIYKALINIEKTCPELFFLIRHTKIEAVKGGTAYATKTKTGYKVGINENWIEIFDLHNLSAIIEHELLHIVLEHCTDLRYLDKRLANIAMDAIINDIGFHFQDKAKLNPELQKGVYIEALNDKYKTDFNTYKNTALDIYNFLSNQKNNDKLESFDQGLDSENGEGEEGEGNGPGEELSKELKEAAAAMGQDGKESGLEDLLSPEEMASIYKAYGTKASDVKKYLDAIEKREKNRKIKNAIENFFSSNKSNHKKSIKKINKRFNFLPYGRQKDSTQKILLALDVSGSMLNPEEIAKMQMSVNSAVNNGFKVDIVFGDVKRLGGFKDIKPNFDFSKIHGGGGTVLDFIFEEKDAYDCYVIVTDGEFNHNCIPKKLTNAILFLNTTSRPVKGYKNLFI